LLYVIDPMGPHAAPDEVELMTYNDNKAGIWAAFRLSAEYPGKVSAPALKSTTESKSNTKVLIPQSRRAQT